MTRPEGAKDGDRIFPYEYNYVYRLLKEALTAAGITLTGTACHAPRRTHATLMDAAGARDLREQMGHADEAMTGVYIRKSFADHQEKAMRVAEMLIGAREEKGRVV